MKCIDDELIQKYIDNEVSLEDAANIDEHLLSCAECRYAVDKQKKLVGEVRDVINLFQVDAIEIPTFNIPVKDSKEVRPVKDVRIKLPVIGERKNRRAFLRWSLIAVSAACILVCVLFTLRPEKNTPIDPDILLYGAENEFDANRSISQQDIVVKMVDSEGNIYEYKL